MTTFAWDGEKLVSVQTVTTLPADFTGSNSTAELKIHPGGKFLYSSNRGHDSIACYGIDDATGHLTVIEHTPLGGKTPRDFALDPSGAFLVAGAQDTHNMVSFRIDSSTGRLTKVGEASGFDAPVCIVFVPQS